MPSPEIVAVPVPAIIPVVADLLTHLLCTVTPVVLQLLAVVDTVGTVVGKVLPTVSGQLFRFGAITDAGSLAGALNRTSTIAGKLSGNRAFANTGPLARGNTISW